MQLHCSTMSSAGSRPDSQHAGLVAATRQYLQGCALLGVDFVPLRTSCASTMIDVKSHNAAAAADDTSSSISTARQPAANHPAPVARSAPAAAASSKLDALNKLRLEHDAKCPHCTGADSHTQTVFGEGNPDADLMFVGEAPGEAEDRTGRPFVGRAGQKLDEIIKAIGLSREQVYIANVLKARPPENRTPLPHEVDACAPFLAQQIRIIQPKVIVALGGPAAKWLLKTDEGITRLRGQWGSYVDGDLCVAVMPTFHPAYLLRNYTVDTRKKVWSDMQQACSRISST